MLYEYVFIVTNRLSTRFTNCRWTGKSLLETGQLEYELKLAMDIKDLTWS